MPIHNIFGFFTKGDPHGYQALLKQLQDIQKKLQEHGFTKAADYLNEPIGFYGGGTPTEFLGISRNALRATLQEIHLPDQLREEIQRVIDLISDSINLC